MASPDLGGEPKPRKPRIVSLGELLWDIFPDGQLLGGAAANVAFHAAALGARATLVSRVGDDFLGREAVRFLADQRVNVDLVGKDPIVPTGQVLVTLVDSEPRFDIGAPAAWDRITLSTKIMEALRQADVVCFGTLICRTKWMKKQLARALVELRGLGHSWPSAQTPRARPLLVLDLNLRPPHTDRETVRGILGLADVVKLNEQELEWLQEYCPGRPVQDWLFETYPVQLVALTRGPCGATLRSRRVSVSAPGHPAAGGDPVGAGDAFVASLACSLASNASLPRALEHANRYAAWVASQVGAMPCSRPGLSRLQGLSC